MIQYMQDSIVDRGEWTDRRSNFVWASSGRGDHNRDSQQVRHIFVANYIKDRGWDIRDLNVEYYTHKGEWPHESSSESEEERTPLEHRGLFSRYQGRVSSDLLLRPNYLLSAVNHYLTMDQHIMRACFNYDMELNMMSEVVFPFPE